MKPLFSNNLNYVHRLHRGALFVSLCRLNGRCTCDVRWISLQHWQTVAETTANILQKSCRSPSQKLPGSHRSAGSSVQTLLVKTVTWSI